jgi:type I restriction-modification system DNA methylase subunit
MFFFFDEPAVAVLDKPVEPAPQPKRVYKSPATWAKQFKDIFQRLCYKQQAWRVWSDFVEMAACAISNSVDAAHYETREAKYMSLIKAYDKQDADRVAQLLATVTQALDDDPEQDFLGNLFQELELSNHWRGQFFTPYSLSRMLAGIQIGDIQERIKVRGYVSVNDPACGAGALLIAYANAVKEKDINYQRHVLFVGQDIDQTAAQMCYIQLSLLGCAGYVIVGDTIKNDPREQDVWYTPMWFSPDWRMYRLIESLRRVEV